MKDYKIKYTKKVTKTDQARRRLSNSPNSGVGKVIDTEIIITEFEVVAEAKLGGLGR